MKYTSYHEAFTNNFNDDETSNLNLLNRQDPVDAFYNLSADKFNQVPRNNSVYSRQDYSNTYYGGNNNNSNNNSNNNDLSQIYKNDENDKEVKIIETTKDKKCGDDHDCMDMINHMLSCDSCLTKFKKILNCNTDNKIFGLDFSSSDTSKLLFFFMVGICFIVVCQILQLIFNKLIS